MARKQAVVKKSVALGKRVAKRSQIISQVTGEPELHYTLEQKFEDNFYTVFDMMDRFLQSREWVLDHFVNSGQFPYRKLGNMYVWHKDHIDAWAKGDDRPKHLGPPVTSDPPFTE